MQKLLGLGSEKISANELSQSESVKLLLENLIEDLPSREKQVIRLRFWRNMDFYEIADCLEMRVSTVNNIFVSAMKRLKMSKKEILNEFNKRRNKNV